MSVRIIDKPWSFYFEPFQPINLQDYDYQTNAYKITVYPNFGLYIEHMQVNELGTPLLQIQYDNAVFGSYILNGVPKDYYSRIIDIDISNVNYIGQYRVGSIKNKNKITLPPYFDGNKYDVYINLHDNGLYLANVEHIYDYNGNFKRSELDSVFFPFDFQQDTRIETDCCLLVCCEPTKYKLKV